MVNKRKCMLVSVLGLPNAGKSTLVNKLIGTKVSIVSPKVQTTRSRVRGILTEDYTQIIFIDTPGIFKAVNKLGKSMVKTAFGALQGVDAVIYLIDSSKNKNEENKLIEERLAQLTLPVYIVYNKIDLEKNATEIEAFSPELEKLVKEKISISARTRENLEELKKILFRDAPTSEFLYDENDITDLASAVLASEITREKLYLKLAEELPYDATVETERLKLNEKDEIIIHQSIYVKKMSQKKIVIGDNARKIKEISLLAKKDMEKIFEKKVHLYLHARVKENWQSLLSFYDYLGMEKPD